MNLKIYRKLFVLIVLTVGLFFASSINKAGAEPCCPVCDYQLTMCIKECTYSDRECLDNCDAEYVLCRASLCPQCP